MRDVLAILVLAVCLVIELLSPLRANGTDTPSDPNELILEAAGFAPAQKPASWSVADLFVNWKASRDPLADGDWSNNPGMPGRHQQATEAIPSDEAPCSDGRQAGALLGDGSTRCTFSRRYRPDRRADSATSTIHR